jgi:hypothetical protein
VIPFLKTLDINAVVCVAVCDDLKLGRGTQGTPKVPSIGLIVRA